MESHSLLDTCINNGLRHLTEDLQEPYPSDNCVKLGDEDQDHPSQICRDSPMFSHKLGQLHKFHSFSWFGVVVGGWLPPSPGTPPSDTY